MSLEQEIQKQFITEKGVDPMIRYRFEFTNEYGDEYSLENKVTLLRDVGDSEELELARAINLFMKQIGYSYDKDMIFLESVTEDEFDYLADCLFDYRAGKVED